MLALRGLKAPGQSDRLLADNSLLAANTGKQAAKEGASAHIPGPGLSCPSGEMNRPERERREARRGRGLMIRANAAGARNNRQRSSPPPPTSRSARHHCCSGSPDSPHDQSQLLGVFLLAPPPGRSCRDPIRSGTIRSQENRIFHLREQNRQAPPTPNFLFTVPSDERAV